MTIFKVNKRSFGQVRRRLVDDIADDFLNEMKEQLIFIRSYYCEVADSFVIESIPDGNIIGSEEWGAAALDVGADWTWSKMPPIDKIMDWVRKHKDGGRYSGSPDREVRDIAARIANKILKEGVDSHFYVDSSIRFFSDSEVTLV